MVELIEYLATPIAQVALIMGIAEIAKRVGLNGKFIPILDLILGLSSGIGIYHFGLGYGWTEGILVGIALGLSACGLFSGVKNVLKKSEEIPEDIIEEVTEEETDEH